MDDGSGLLTSAADDKVAAIARTSSSARILAETLMLRQKAAEVRNDARALGAEARQVRTRKHNAGRDQASD